MGRPRLVEVHWSCAARALTTLMLAAPSLGCGSSSATLASEGPPPSLDNFEALRRGDVIEVKVFREADLDGVFRVGVGGDIDFPSSVRWTSRASGRKRSLAISSAGSPVTI